MLRDAEQLQIESFRDEMFDVCIVGSGPAGMSLALKLAEKGWKIGLFEAGGLEPTPQSTRVYSGKNIGLDYYPLDAVRLRFFGGTSNHWEGMCRQLEDFDFEPVPNDRLSGWPIRKPDIEAYATETEKILDIAPARPIHDLFHGDSGALVPIRFRWSKPTRFGKKYKDAISASHNIQAFLNANLVDLELSGDSRRVVNAVFRSYSRPQPFVVRAKHFALCLGGLENPRFLLNANRQLTHGIGNQNDLVGRYFCEHTTFHLGQMLLASQAQQGYPQGVFFRPKREFLASAGVNNFCLRLEGGLVHTPDSATTSTLRRALCDYPLLARVANALRGVEMGCFDAVVRVQAAQALNPESRVSLGNDLDQFGMRRIQLDWRLTQVDKKTLRIAAMELGKQLVRTDVGRLKLNDWLLEANANFPTTAQDQPGGYHHMCTTRMSADPKLGVVDADCRVHAMDNLYLGGSSVFATPGFANPTFTIVQLALRLADHLDNRLKGLKL